MHRISIKIDNRNDVWLPFTTEGDQQVTDAVIASLKNNLHVVAIKTEHLDVVASEEWVREEDETY